MFFIIKQNNKHIFLLLEKYAFILFFLITIFIIPACEDDEMPPPPPPNSGCQDTVLINNVIITPHTKNKLRVALINMLAEEEYIFQAVAVVDSCEYFSDLHTFTTEALPAEVPQITHHNISFNFDGYILAQSRRYIHCPKKIRLLSCWGLWIIWKWIFLEMNCADMNTVWIIRI